MKRLIQSAATLLLGAGLGAAGSRLLPPGGWQEEDDGTGLLSRVPVVPVVQASELAVSSNSSEPDAQTSDAGIRAAAVLLSTSTSSDSDNSRNRWGEGFGKGVCLVVRN